jgi:hypothetical protein
MVHRPNINHDHVRIHRFMDVIASIGAIGVYSCYNACCAAGLGLLALSTS